MAVCKACGETYIKSYNSQAYCCDECREVARKQQWRNASHKHYHKHKHEWGSNSVRRYGLGTGTLGPHANIDFESEKQTIERELARLRIK
ncbi:MAG: hypothetical protein IJ743_00470 [Bacilli bacterium]|nr:hypothetical protein [Bacilli bacterium]